MLDRRRMLITNNQQNDDYVTDGLILFLDGLNQGDETGKWIDTVNGREFILTNATQNSNCVSFNRGYATSAENIPFKTIELVFKWNRNQNYDTVFTANGNRTYNIFKNGTFLSFGGLSIPFTINKINNYSALFDTSIFDYKNIKTNNVTQQTSSSVFWGTQPSGVNIGYYNSSYTASADFYALRLYDRELTDEERTKNFILDVKRYGVEI